MLSADEIASFRTRLETDHAQVVQQIADLERELASPDVVSDAEGDIGDDGNMLFAHEQSLDQIARLREHQDAITRALARIADGTYGLSVVSGKPIPRERLEALPTAATLVDEQET